MKQAHIFVGGYVQGVGFRDFVKQHAQRLHIAGWVCNLPDRRVEVLAQGEKDVLEKLILLCQKGPFMADVKAVNVVWEKDEELFSDFVILKTPSTTT